MENTKSSESVRAHQSITQVEENEVSTGSPQSDSQRDSSPSYAMITISGPGLLHDQQFTEHRIEIEKQRSNGGWAEAP